MHHRNKVSLTKCNEHQYQTKDNNVRGYWAKIRAKVKLSFKVELLLLLLLLQMSMIKVGLSHYCCTTTLQVKKLRETTHNIFTNKSEKQLVTLLRYIFFKNVTRYCHCLNCREVRRLNSTANRPSPTADYCHM